MSFPLTIKSVTVFLIDPLSRPDRFCCRSNRFHKMSDAENEDAANASGPSGRAPGPFGSLRRNATVGALGGAKPRAEPAEIFVWDALSSQGEEDEARARSTQ